MLHTPACRRKSKFFYRSLTAWRNRSRPEIVQFTVLNLINQIIWFILRPFYGHFFQFAFQFNAPNFGFNWMKFATAIFAHPVWKLLILPAEVSDTQVYFKTSFDLNIQKNNLPVEHNREHRGAYFPVSDLYTPHRNPAGIRLLPLRMLKIKNLAKKPKKLIKNIKVYLYKTWPFARRSSLWKRNFLYKEYNFKNKYTCPAEWSKLLHPNKPPWACISIFCP